MQSEFRWTRLKYKEGQRQLGQAILHHIDKVARRQPLVTWVPVQQGGGRTSMVAWRAQMGSISLIVTRRPQPSWRPPSPCPRLRSRRPSSACRQA